MPRVNLVDTVKLLEAKATKCQDFKAICKDIQIKDNGNTIVIKGVEYPILNTGKTTLCKTLHMPGNYFRKYPVVGELDEHANTWLSKTPEQEVLVRILDNRVRAILPSSFFIFDYLQGLAAIIEGLKGQPEISLDVYDITDSQAVFNIIYGSELLLGKGLLPFVRFVGSEIGQGNLTVSNGIFNVVDSSSIVIQSKTYGHIKWGYKGKGGKSMGYSITNSAKNSIINVRVMQQALVDSQRDLLGITTEDILKVLVERKDISSKIATKLSDEISVYNPKTVYDFINILMGVAQKNRSLNGRFKLEDILGRILIDKYIKLGA